MRARIFFASCLVLISGIYLFSQAAGGTLTGIVHDSSGAVVPGVSVRAIHSASQRIRSAVTNSSGSYVISDLPTGSYDVEFTKAGFSKIVRKALQIRVGEVTRGEAELRAGPISESVNVDAPAPALQADSAALSSVIGHEQILSLPNNGRLFTNLVQTTAGAVTAAPGSHLSSRGGFNVAGADEHYNSSLLDGLDNVDPVIRNISYPPPLEFVDEFQVIENGGSAEFGRNAGAVINATTRSGSAAFHGSGWQDFMNDNLNAKNYFALAGEKPPLLRNQFGGTFSGPIDKKRTFFFAGYEGLRMKAGDVHRAAVPTLRMRTGDLGEFAAPIINPSTGVAFTGNVIPQAAINAVAREVLQAYPLPNAPGLAANRIETANVIQNGNDVTVRLDHALTDHNQIMGRFSSSRLRIDDPYHSEAGISANLAEFGQTADKLRTNFSVALISRPDGNWTNDLRAGYNRFHQPQLPSNPGTPLQQPLMGFEKAFLDFIIPPFETIGSAAEFDRAVNVYNYVDSISYTTGNHHFKAGADLRRYLFNFFVAGPNTFQFAGASSARSGNAFADFLLGLPATTISVTGSPGGNSRKTELALFIQDDWKANSRLTVNYGVRWEYYGRITEKNNKQSIWLESCNCIAVAGEALPPQLVDNDLNNFAPRLGLAYRPWGEHTAIRASGGIYYDNDMRHNAEVIGNPPFVLNQLFLSNFIPALSLDNPFPSGAGLPSLNPVTLDRHYRDTYAETWNLSLQHEIPQRTLIEVAYLGSHTVKARRAVNLDQPVNGKLPYPQFSRILAFEQAGNANFNALQIKAERHVWQGFGWTGVYMWGHAIDDRPAQGSASRVQNNNNMTAERGDSDFDVRQRATVSGIYQVPFKRLGNWSLNGILTLQSGRPFSVTLDQDWSHTGNFADRPNAVMGLSTKPANQGPDRWIDPAAFQIPPEGSFGNLGRNTLRGPAYQTVDLSLVRESVLHESGRLQLRIDAFNLFNHPNFNLPNAALDPINPSATPGFGVITSTIGAERQIQLAVRLSF